ncbi:hypothetical protein [Methylotenera oryzisoli]|nr:hypothetical protein [Methylotenera oryzisoli]
MDNRQTVLPIISISNYLKYASKSTLYSMLYKLLSIKSIARLISIIGILTALAAITQLNMDLYENKVIEKAQLSATQPDKDSNRDLSDTIVDIIPRSTYMYSTYIMLHHDYASYQEPTLLLYLRPPLQSHSLA